MRNPTTFAVPGKPSPKKRPRVVRLPNGQSHTFTPDAVGFVPAVQVHALNAGVEVSDGVVALSVTVYREMPASWSAKKRGLMCGLPSTETPDRINVAAAICDALEGVAYKNDKQVMLDTVWQFYAEHHSTQITVRPLPN